MFSIFTYPLMWLAAIALPALVSIYFLHHHYRRRQVSSLMLWVEGRELSNGGQSFKRLSFPWIFLLELSIIILLILAGIGWHYNTTRPQQRVAVILDNSISMQALRSDGKPVREFALTSLKKRLSDPRLSIARVLITGSEMIPVEAATAAEMLSEIKLRWDCSEHHSDLAQAITTLKRTHPAADIIVVTDQPPPPDSPIGVGIIWLACGQPQDNLAIVNAVRNPSSTTHSRCLVEIANFSRIERTANTEWQINDKIIHTDTSLIAAGERITLEHRFPYPADEITITIKESDALSLDNSARLLPPPVKDLRIKLEIADANLYKTIVETIKATKSAYIVTRNPELYITDAPSAGGLNAAASLHLIKSKEMLSCTGPFIVDSSHPLTDGINFDSLIWAASTNISLNGTALISAGNTPLLSINNPNRRHTALSMQLDLARSNIHLTPAWPVLFWNLIDWRLSSRSGFKRANYHTGIPFQLKLNRDESAAITDPSGATRQCSSKAGLIMINSQTPGIYTARINDRISRAALNILAPDESNLQTNDSGSWGRLTIEQTLEAIERSTAPWFALAALLLLFTHHFLISVKPIAGGGA